MTPTLPKRVRFEFVPGTTFEGDVVAAEPIGAFNATPDHRLTVDVDGVTYPALESEATPV